MKITICGSLTHLEKIVETKNKLSQLGFDVELPHNAERFLKENNFNETASKEKKNWYIKQHLKKIRRSDAILVVNEEKNGIKNYIGGNTFLEIGFAFALDKHIFLKNPIPKMPYEEEIKGMLPIVLPKLTDISKLIYR